MKPNQTQETLAELGDKISQKEQELQDIKEQIESLENEDLHSEYDNMLNDIGISQVVLSDYSASDVLKKVDETKYNVGYDEYVDNRVNGLEASKSDVEQELNDLREQEQNG